MTTLFRSVIWTIDALEKDPHATFAIDEGELVDVNGEEFVRRGNTLMKRDSSWTDLEQAESRLALRLRHIANCLIEQAKKWEGTGASDG